MTAGDDGLAVTSYNYAAWEAWRGDCIYSSENFFVVGLVAEIWEAYLCEVGVEWRAGDIDNGRCAYTAGCVLYAEAY